MARSGAGIRWRVILSADVLTISRVSHNARRISARDVSRRLVQIENSAADWTCAWMPPVSRTTSATDRAATAFALRLASCWRARRNAAACAAVTRNGFGSDTDELPLFDRR